MPRKDTENNIGQMDPAQGLIVVGGVMLVLMLITLAMVQFVQPSGSSNIGAVEISENVNKKELTVSVLNSQSVSRFKIVTGSGSVYYLDASAGNSKTISATTITVYAISKQDGEEKQLQTYTASW